VDQSEEQFSELLSHVIARAKATLRDRGQLVPIGFQLTPGGEVELALAITAEGEPSRDLLIEQLTEKAKEGSFVACAMAWCGPEDEELTVYLENNENYCTDLTIPCVRGADIELDMERLSIEDGRIRVFPKLS
jgi:hypothetical protein